MSDLDWAMLCQEYEGITSCEPIDCGHLVCGITLFEISVGSKGLFIQNTGHRKDVNFVMLMILDLVE